MCKNDIYVKLNQRAEETSVQMLQEEQNEQFASDSTLLDSFQGQEMLGGNPMAGMNENSHQKSVNEFKETLKGYRQEHFSSNRERIEERTKTVAAEYVEKKQDEVWNRFIAVSVGITQLEESETMVYEQMALKQGGAGNANLQKIAQKYFKTKMSIVNHKKYDQDKKDRKLKELKNDTMKSIVGYDEYVANMALSNKDELKNVLREEVFNRERELLSVNKKTAIDRVATLNKYENAVSIQEDYSLVYSEDSELIRHKNTIERLKDDKRRPMVFISMMEEPLHAIKAEIAKLQMPGDILKNIGDEAVLQGIALNIKKAKELQSLVEIIEKDNYCSASQSLKSEEDFEDLNVKTSLFQIVKPLASKEEWKEEKARRKALLITEEEKNKLNSFLKVEETFKSKCMEKHGVMGTGTEIRQEMEIKLQQMGYTGFREIKQSLEAEQPKLKEKNILEYYRQIDKRGGYGVITVEGMEVTEQGEKNRRAYLKALHSVPEGERKALNQYAETGRFFDVHVRNIFRGGDMKYHNFKGFTHMTEEQTTDMFAKTLRVYGENADKAEKDKYQKEGLLQILEGHISHYDYITRKYGNLLSNISNIEMIKLREKIIPDLNNALDGTTILNDFNSLIEKGIITGVKPEVMARLELQINYFSDIIDKMMNLSGDMKKEVPDEKIAIYKYKVNSEGIESVKACEEKLFETTVPIQKGINYKVKPRSPQKIYEQLPLEVTDRQRRESNFKRIKEEQINKNTVEEEEVLKGINEAEEKLEEELEKRYDIKIKDKENAESFREQLKKAKGAVFSLEKGKIDKKAQAVFNTIRENNKDAVWEKLVSGRVKQNLSQQKAYRRLEEVQKGATLEEKIYAYSEEVKKINQKNYNEGKKERKINELKLKTMNTVEGFEQYVNNIVDTDLLEQRRLTSSMQREVVSSELTLLSMDVKVVEKHNEQKTKYYDENNKLEKIAKEKSQKENGEPATEVEIKNAKMLHVLQEAGISKAIIQSVMTTLQNDGAKTLSGKEITKETDVIKKELKRIANKQTNNMEEFVKEVNVAKTLKAAIHRLNKDIYDDLDENDDILNQWEKTRKAMEEDVDKILNKEALVVKKLDLKSLFVVDKIMTFEEKENVKLQQWRDEIFRKKGKYDDNVEKNIRAFTKATGGAEMEETERKSQKQRSIKETNLLNLTKPVFDTKNGKNPLFGKGFAQYENFQGFSPMNEGELVKMLQNLGSEEAVNKNKGLRTLQRTMMSQYDYLTRKYGAACEDMDIQGIKTIYKEFARDTQTCENDVQMLNIIEQGGKDVEVAERENIEVLKAQILYFREMKKLFNYKIEKSEVKNKTTSGGLLQVSILEEHIEQSHQRVQAKGKIFFDEELYYKSQGINLEAQAVEIHGIIQDRNLKKNQYRYEENKAQMNILNDRLYERVLKYGDPNVKLDMIDDKDLSAEEQKSLDHMRGFSIKFSQKIKERLETFKGEDAHEENLQLKQENPEAYYSKMVLGTQMSGEVGGSYDPSGEKVMKQYARAINAHEQKALGVTEKQASNIDKKLRGKIIAGIDIHETIFRGGGADAGMFKGLQTIEDERLRTMFIKMGITYEKEDLEDNSEVSAREKTVQTNKEGLHIFKDGVTSQMDYLMKTYGTNLLDLEIKDFLHIYPSVLSDLANINIIASMLNYEELFDDADTEEFQNLKKQVKYFEQIALLFYNRGNDTANNEENKELQWESSNINETLHRIDRENGAKVEDYEMYVIAKQLESEIFDGKMYDHKAPINSQVKLRTYEEIKAEREQHKNKESELATVQALTSEQVRENVERETEKVKAEILEANRNAEEWRVENEQLLEENLTLYAKKITTGEATGKITASHSGIEKNIKGFLMAINGEAFSEASSSENSGKKASELREGQKKAQTLYGTNFCGINMKEHFARQGASTFVTLRSSKDVTEDYIAEMYGKIGTDERAFGDAKEAKEEANKVNLEGLCMFKNVLVEHFDYMARAYGNNLEKVEMKELLKIYPKFIEDMACGQVISNTIKNLGGVIKEKSQEGYDMLKNQLEYYDNLKVTLYQKITEFALNLNEEIKNPLSIEVEKLGKEIFDGRTYKSGTPMDLNAEVRSFKEIIAEQREYGQK